MPDGWTFHRPGFRPAPRTCKRHAWSGPLPGEAAAASGVVWVCPPGFAWGDFLALLKGLLGMILLLFLGFLSRSKSCWWFYKSLRLWGGFQCRPWYHCMSFHICTFCRPVLAWRFPLMQMENGYEQSCEIINARPVCESVSILSLHHPVHLHYILNIFLMYIHVSLNSNENYWKSNPQKTHSVSFTPFPRR